MCFMGSSELGTVSRESARSAVDTLWIRMGGACAGSCCHSWTQAMRTGRPAASRLIGRSDKGCCSNANKGHQLSCRTQGKRQAAVDSYAGENSWIHGGTSEP